jgi:hypothetical protein
VVRAELACGRLALTTAWSTACSSVLRHEKLYAIAPANLEKARNIRWPRWGWQIFGPRGHWLPCLREEADMSNPGGVHDQKPCWIRSNVLEGMHLPLRDLDEFASLGMASLRSDAELEGPIKYVERFVICRVAVGRWPCARAHKRLNEAVSRVRIADEEAQQDAGYVVGVSLQVRHQFTSLRSMPHFNKPLLFAHLPCSKPFRRDRLQVRNPPLLYRDAHDEPTSGRRLRGGTSRA